MTATFKVTFGELKCIDDPSSKTIDKSCLAKFWDNVGSGLRRGVYIFGVKAGKGWKPLYVGRTKKQNFKKRIAQHTGKNGDFNHMLVPVKKGKPVLFLIGRTGKGKLSNSVIDELEIEIINYAFAKNKNLNNDRGIKTPKYTISGFGSKGKPSTSAKNLKLMIGY